MSVNDNGCGPAAPTNPWNPRASLRCIGCGGTAAIAPAFGGCARCGDPLEVVYDMAGRPDGGDLRAVLDWAGEALLPVARSTLVALGGGGTPLVEVPAFGPGVLVKNEAANPTWAHKDRFHALAVGIARLAGAEGVVTVSTGNHGAAAAAFAGAAGLRALVLAHPDASTTTLAMIQAYGGLAAQLDPAEARALLPRLVDAGWWPVTSMDPELAGRGNPYGAEGYKAIGYEVTATLGRLPAAVVVPTASGDTFYGIAKGFAEVAELTGAAPPTMIAAQPATADPLARSLRAGHDVAVPDAHSIALSVSDPRTGRHAVAAARRWNGMAVSVTETAIADATRRFARAGLLVEPASAVSLAGYEVALAAERVEPGATAVLIATCSGAKWPAALAEIVPNRPLRSVDAVRAALSLAETST